MSSEAMRALAREIADYAAETPNWKERVSAVADAIGVSWGRAKTLYYASARRVDADEMDKARRAAHELKEAKRRAEDIRFINRLKRTIEHLRSVDPEFYSADIAQLERVLAQSGAVGSALEGAGKEGAGE